MEKIRKQFELNFGLSAKDWDVFSSHLTQVSYLKNETILEMGQTEQYLSFVDQGIVRFYIPKPDNDLTFGFIFENSFYSAYDSFLTQSPSTYRVKTITDTVLWRLTYESLQEIYRDTEKGNLIGRKASEDLFLLKSARELSLLNNTAEQRYLKLFTQRPELIRSIPLKYVASYIGITPQALSRIRKRIS